MEYYLVLKRNKFSNHEKTLWKLKHTLLRKRTNVKRIHAMYDFKLYNILKDKAMETVKGSVLARGLEN